MDSNEATGTVPIFWNSRKVKYIPNRTPRIASITLTAAGRNGFDTGMLMVRLFPLFNFFLPMSHFGKFSY
jgi:hypothetical protein